MAQSPKRRSREPTMEQRIILCHLLTTIRAKKSATAPLLVAIPMIMNVCPTIVHLFARAISGDVKNLERIPNPFIAAIVVNKALNISTTQETIAK